MKTGFEAAKLGFAAYIIPFMLVLHPALLLLGDVSLLESVLSMLTAAAGLTCMAASFEGWLLRRASILQRILLFVAGICLVAPPLSLGGIGLGLLALVVLWQKFHLGYAK